jgi:3-(3-hydroxy-phenyl)propionate hydroxylase
MALSYESDGAAIQQHAYTYRRSADQDSTELVRHPVVVVGAGPVGLSLAIDLAQRGQRVLLLDNDDRLSTGSRAICFAKRTLEIWDRLGVGDRMCAKGVGWSVGKVFLQDKRLYEFDLLPEADHQRPAFINLQQYYAEAWLAVRAAELPEIEIRWKNTVVACEQDEGATRLKIETPDGSYAIVADWVVASDGSRSPLRAMLGQESTGRVFRDRFLIADVKMEAEFPAERWFWFDPPFHPNQSVLLHRQPDNVLRIDFQLGWDADPEQEKRAENIKPRVDAMMKAALGREVPYELEWASVYTFACLRMEQFVHGRVIFTGDAAHGVSPFGARGANSGVQDADNLGWKLDLVLRGLAPKALLETYGPEREYAADENILNSTRATDFITPKSPISHLFRDAVLHLAREHPFARKIVNSGRLSTPSTLHDSSLNTPDRDTFKSAMSPGAPASDAPMDNGGWLLRRLAGNSFKLLVFGVDAKGLMADSQSLVPIDIIELPLDSIAAKRYDAQRGTVYLLRPDQHVCARWRAPTKADLAAAMRRALALH